MTVITFSIFLSVICSLNVVQIAEGCMPGNDASLALLKLHLGIEPVSTTSVELKTGYTDDFINSASDLNCDFTRPEDCRWKNYQSQENREDDRLDSIDWFLFRKSAGTIFPLDMKPDGPGRTPPIGDQFLLAGGEGLPKKNALLYSAPILCTSGPAELSFNIFHFRNARLRVMLLETTSLRQVGYMASCKVTSSRCFITIQARNHPFHLAIQGHDFMDNLAIIDNIRFVTDLGPKCKAEKRGSTATIPQKIKPKCKGPSLNGLDSLGPLGASITTAELNKEDCLEVNPLSDNDIDNYDFALSSQPFETMNQRETLKDDVSLGCYEFSAACRWSNAVFAEPRWMVQKGNMKRDIDVYAKWINSSGSMDPPSGNFLLARGKEGMSELVSHIILCQPKDVSGLLSFKAWMSPGTKVEVCRVHASGLSAAICYPAINRDDANKPYYAIEIPGPIEFETLVIRASEWNNGKGGFAAVDDIIYTAVMCEQAKQREFVLQYPSTTTTTTQSVPTTAQNDYFSEYDKSAELYPEFEMITPPRPTKATPATTTEDENNLMLDMLCDNVQCDFESPNLATGGFCEYLSTDKRNVMLTPYDNENPKFGIVANGRFGNRITGIMNGPDDGYLAVYLLPGQRAQITTYTFLPDELDIAFYYYEATHGMTLMVCCNFDCANVSADDIADRARWRVAVVKCAAGTSELSFSCRNDQSNDVKNQGACGLDKIRVTQSRKLPTATSAAEPQLNFICPGSRR